MTITASRPRRASGAPRRYQVRAISRCPPDRANRTRHPMGTGYFPLAANRKSCVGTIRALALRCGCGRRWGVVRVPSVCHGPFRARRGQRGRRPRSPRTKGTPRVEETQIDPGTTHREFGFISARLTSNSPTQAAAGERALISSATQATQPRTPRGPDCFIAPRPEAAALVRPAQRRARHRPAAGRQAAAVFGVVTGAGEAPRR
jgi:hypothetical protein